MHSKDPLGFRFLFTTVQVLCNSCGLILLELVNVLLIFHDLLSPGKGERARRNPEERCRQTEGALQGGKFL